MSKLSVSIPENLLTTINQRIESGDYSSISDYIRDLIRRDTDRGATGADTDRQEEETTAEKTLPLP